jgi:hypothetical protein
LSSGGLIIFVKGTPSNAILDENFDFLGQKMIFQRKIYGTLEEKFSKNNDPFPIKIFLTLTLPSRFLARLMYGFH